MVIQRIFLTPLLTAPVLERLVFHEKIPVCEFFKIPLLEEIGFLGRFPLWENSFPVCGPSAVVCEDFEFFKVPSVGPVLWCVSTLSFFKVPLCVGSVLWCVNSVFEN